MRLRLFLFFLRLFLKMGEICCFSSLGLLVLCICINVDLILIFKKLFIFGCAGSLAAWAFSLVAAGGDCSLVVVGRLLIAAASPGVEHRLWAAGVSVAVAHGRSNCCSWALRHGLKGHVGPSRTRDRTCVSYIGRWILYHRATREGLILIFIYLSKLLLKDSCFTMLC